MAVGTDDRWGSLPSRSGSLADGDDKYPFALEGRDPNGQRVGSALEHCCAVRLAVLCAGEPTAPEHVSCRLWRVMFHVPAAWPNVSCTWLAGGRSQNPISQPSWLGGIGWLLEDAEPANAVQQKPPYHGSTQDRPRQAAPVCWLGSWSTRRHHERLCSV